MTGVLLVITAAETREAAEALATSAVQQRLASGAQIVGPVTSVFWHLGQYGMGEEFQILLTTSSGRYEELEAHLLANHPWDSPSIMAIPVTAGPDRCLRWVSQSLDSEHGLA